MSTITFIVGPTATGKSEVSYLLAKEICGEIVSADSMLIYKEPEITTAKPSYKILNQIKHHFVGTMSVRESYSVFDYYRSATRIIRELFSKGIPVIVCGGSGLYLKALLDGIFEGAGKNEGLRKKLEEQAGLYGTEYLYDKLKNLDEPSAKRISPQDLRRIIRALEVYYLTGTPLSEKQMYSFGLYDNLPIKIFGFRLERKELYRRIEQRVDKMFTQGAADEVSGLRQFNLSLTSRKIIGISEIGEFLDGKIKEDQALSKMKINTRRFAKRQITWFKKDKRIEWLDIDNLTPANIKEEILSRMKDA
jgi:tRNA dimethylallyltransferase